METLLPEVISPAVAVFLVCLAFFTSGLTAVAGIGGGMLMLGAMSYVIPVAALIPVHGLVQLGSNASRSWIQREHIHWRIISLFMVGGVVGVIIGILFIVQIPERIFFALIGLGVLLMVWVKFPKLKTANNAIIFIGGAVTNFISMFAGATGPLVAVFLNNLFESHKNMAATTGMTMTAQHGFKILAFGLVGFQFTEWLPLVAAMVCMGFMGAKAGTMLMYQLPEKMLKTGFKFVITVIALDMLRRAFF